MKLFVIIATVVACACAAPTVELQHPSPVNPSVLVELKPQEKIILITDPKEIAKFKRETKQPLYPTVLPGEHVHHITKRDHKPVHDAKAPKTPKAPTVTKKPQVPNKPSLTKRNRRNVESYQKPEHIKAEEFQKPQTLPVFLTTEDVSQETLESKNKRRDDISKTNNDNKETHKDKEDVTTEVYQKPQGLPAIFSPSNKSTQQQKRDIPVPLVPKYHHPEESPKETTEKEVQGEKQVHTTEVFQKPQGLPAIFSPSNDAPQKRDIPVPLVPKYHHPEESPKDIDEKEIHEVKKEVNSENYNVQQTLQAHIPDHVTVEGFEKPQTLPLLLKESPKDTQQQKRDIPVPLVPKHQHPEETSKYINEKETHDVKKEENSEDHHDHKILQAHIQDHVTTIPLILKDIQQHKRDIPVPLVPKHQHPEESPKDINEKETHDYKKVVNSENHHELQTSPAQNNDHVTTVEIQKPQTLPLLLKETTEDTQQHKRDIPVPLIPKQHHSEEPLKDSHESELHIDEKKHKVHKEESVKENSNEKELHEQRENEKSENHPVPQIHLIPQTLPTYNHENLNTQGIHKPQVLPAFNNDHISQSSFEKSQILPNLQDHINKNNNGKTEEDIQVHHISQTLPAHIHKHLATEGFQKPQPGHNQEHAEVTGFHKPQALPPHHYEHIHPEGVQKSQTIPAVFKDSADATEHEASNVSGPVKGHHQEEKQKESHENIKEVKTSTENHPNKHEVQVEDLSESKPYQQPIHHGVPIQGDQKPNIQNDHTIDHPALRHRPVPVAELFARARVN